MSECHGERYAPSLFVAVVAKMGVMRAAASQLWTAQPGYHEQHVLVAVLKQHMLVSVQGEISLQRRDPHVKTIYFMVRVLE